jgi:hypothetical protein
MASVVQNKDADVGRDFSLVRISRTAVHPTQLPVQLILGFFPGRVASRPGGGMSTHFHLVPRLRMIGTVPPFPLMTIHVLLRVS